GLSWPQEPVGRERRQLLVLRPRSIVACCIEQPASRRLRNVEFVAAKISQQNQFVAACERPDDGKRLAAVNCELRFARRKALDARHDFTLPEGEKLVVETQPALVPTRFERDPIELRP